MEQKRATEHPDPDRDSPNIVPMELLTQTAISRIGETSQQNSERQPGERGKSEAEALAWSDRVLKIRRYHQEHDDMCLAIHTMAGDWFRNRNPHVLTIAGNSGCGKTMATKAFHRYCGSTATRALYGGGYTLETPSPWWAYWPDVMASYNDGEAWADLLPSLTDPVILFMDDVGQESDRFKSGDMSRALLSVLSHRARKFTVITTNVEPDRFPEVYGKAVEDRLYRNGGVLVEMFGVRSFNVVE